MIRITYCQKFNMLQKRIKHTRWSFFVKIVNDFYFFYLFSPKSSIRDVSQCPKYGPNLLIHTAQRRKFSIKSKYEQIRRKLLIWSHLLKISLKENFIFCEVL